MDHDEKYRRDMRRLRKEHLKRKIALYGRFLAERQDRLAYYRTKEHATENMIRILEESVANAIEGLNAAQADWKRFKVAGKTR